MASEEAAPAQDRIVDFLHECGHLKAVRRTGWSLAGAQPDDSVAAHSFRVALIAMVLAELTGVARPGDVVAAALVHDLEETRLGDLDHVARRYVGKDEGAERIRAEQLAALPAPVQGVVADAFARLSDPAVSPILRDADALEGLLQACELRDAGHPLMDEWAEDYFARLELPESKALAAAALAGESNRWWLRVLGHR